MVIGRDFVWAHLAKAGGEMTHALFNVFPETIEFADKSQTVEQHMGFQDRLEEVDGKQRVLNIRRLPSWMLSFHVWKSVVGLLPDFEISPMHSPHQIAESNAADAFLARYREPDHPQIDVWLRTEHIIDDFLAFIGNHAEVTPEREEAVRQLPRINELVYDKVIDHWFTSAHIKLMYASNPEWAKVEAYVYGDLSDGSGSARSRLPEPVPATVKTAGPTPS
jgi:hypothetical protein